jgi:hypothetical protein
MIPVYQLGPERKEAEAALPRRLLEKIDFDGPNGCWMWTGARTRTGYGHTSVGYKTWRAHRLVFTLLVRELVQDEQIDHLCHNRDESCHGGMTCPHRLCVNPAHLRPIIWFQHAQERGPGRRNAEKTHCPQGHPYEGENLYHDSKGRRCRACQRAASQRYEAKRRRTA